MEFKEHLEDIDLSNYWAVIKRRWFPASGVFGASIILAALLTAMMEPVYRANAKLLIETDRLPEFTGLESQEDIGELEPLSSSSEPLTTQAEIIKSPFVAQATISALDIRDSEGNLVSPGTIIRDLEVRPVPGADVLQVSYESPDPVLAAAVVNQVIEEYEKKNISMNKAEAAVAREFILKELPSTERAVQSAEAALRQFKEDNNILVLAEEASATVATLTDLDESITTLQAELQDVTAQADGLRNQVGMNPDQAVAMTALSEAPGVQEALVQLQAVQGELSLQRARYRDGHPAVAELQRQAESSSRLLDERIREVLGSEEVVASGNLQLGEVQQGLIADFVRTELTRVGLSQRLSQLIEARNSLQGRSRRLPELEQTQRELERRLSAAETTYETLLSRFQEVQIIENQTIGNAQVISEATVPGNPVTPSKTLNMAAGGVVGGLLAIAAAFLLDLGDRTLKTVKDVKRVFGYPLLGIIPAFESLPNSNHQRQQANARHMRVVVKDMPQSPISSAFHMLQANLDVLQDGHPVHTLVVSSAVSGEGKSEVAANLATAAAQAGQKVLLVDADLRHPTQHSFWNLTNDVGLSNVIVAQTPFQATVHPFMPNLHILTAGMTPPNTLALLNSQQMANLIQSFKNSYDLVILDSPSLAGAADAATLGKMSDGLLLVVRPGTIDAAQAKHAREFLARSGQTVLGVVANGVIVKDEPESLFYFQGSESDRSSAHSRDMAMFPNSA